MAREYVLSILNNYGYRQHPSDFWRLNIFSSTAGILFCDVFQCQYAWKHKTIHSCLAPNEDARMFYDPILMIPIHEFLPVYSLSS